MKRITLQEFCEMVSDKKIDMAVVPPADFSRHEYEKIIMYVRDAGIFEISAVGDWDQGGEVIIEVSD